MLRIKTELDKLEEYLISRRITFERIDEDAQFDEVNRIVIRYARHQICVPCAQEQGECRWDAICQPGSFGYEKGLLEIYGEIVDPQKDGDTVVGDLTAADVIQRLEERKRNEDHI